MTSYAKRFLVGWAWRLIELAILLSTLLLWQDFSWLEPLAIPLYVLIVYKLAFLVVIFFGFVSQNRWEKERERNSGRSRNNR